MRLAGSLSSSPLRSHGAFLENRPLQSWLRLCGPIKQIQKLFILFCRPQKVAPIGKVILFFLAGDHFLSRRINRFRIDG